MKTSLLIDADIVAYQYSAAGQKTFHGFESEDGQPSIHVDDPDEVFVKAVDYIIDIQNKLDADDVYICISDSENFRKTILPSYKSNRDPSLKPILLAEIKERLAKRWPSFIRPSLEADDVMGILSTSNVISGKKIIVSIDKDMKTIPGWLYNPDKDTKPRLVTEAEADRYHLYQTLIGDTTDGYSGCPDVGDVNANEILDNPYLLVPYEYTFKRGVRKGLSETRYTKEATDDIWQAIVSQFERRGLTEEDALVQARVARILRTSDYNFKTKEIILWTPPSKT
jgi:5'-3' exonuclease